MKPDVIVAWPRSEDYPLWRRFVADERERFAKVIVSFTPPLGGDKARDISGWINANFDATFVEPDYSDGRDWRDTAVNAALDRSDAEWVWFTEQDFLVRQPDVFWWAVDVCDVRDTAFGIREHGTGRWHPACLFARREVINQTERYFGGDPVDHFYRFGSQLGPVRPMPILPDCDFEHLAGTSQNHFLIDRGESVGVYHPERFRRYLADCLEAGVPLEPTWAERARREVS